jgi:transposase
VPTLPTAPTAEILSEWRGQPEALIAIIVQQAQALTELREQLAQVQVQLAQSQAQLAEAQARIAELEKQNRPPAAPFRRPDKDKAAAPKRPGRKPGHEGDFRRRPEHCDEEIEVPLAEGCPCCGETLGERQRLEQTIVELPVVRPHVTRLVTWKGYCQHCQQEVRSSHPRQVSTATGAAGTHLGARALGVACALKHQAGLSLRKTTQVLHELCGLELSPGGLAQAFQRVATRLEPAYEELRQDLLQSAVVHTDETSWWVGGPKASLWVFCNAQSTFYRVVESRDRQTFYEVVPADWKGVLVSDCLSVYDDATDLQHKCYAHHLKALRAAIEAGAPPGAGEYVPLCQRLLHKAMELKVQLATLPEAEGQPLKTGLQTAARSLLGEARADPREEAVRLRLHKQIDHLFTFLDHPEVEATNNLAERQLRPAVIARKISCGQRTRKGADAWQVLSSLAATCRQRASSFIDLVAAKMAFAQR